MSFAKFILYSLWEDGEIMKKKKLTYNSLAFSTLKNRKKSYALMIMGIVLAMIFSSGVPFFASCLQSSQKEMQYRKQGKQDTIVTNAQNYELNKAIEDGSIIGEIGYAHIISYAWNEKEDFSDGTMIGWLDERATELYYPVVLDGRMPEKEDEIAIEKSALQRMRLDKKIGEEITLKALVCNSDEFLKEEKEVTYKLVGILHDKKSNIELFYDDNVEKAKKIPAAFVAKNSQVEIGGKEALVAFFNDYWTGDTYLSEISSDNRLDTSRADSNSITDSYTMLTYNIATTIFLSALLAFMSCFGIVNAFNSNLKERKKQIGMLKAVGATRRQLISIFGREAFIICLFTTPLSVAVSFGAVKLFAKIMGENFIFKPNFTVLILGALLGVACVMISAIIPLFSVSRLSPMQAIRNIEMMRKMKNKKIKSEKSFVVSKHLAKRKLVFSKGKSIAISAIVACCVIISGWAISLVNVIADFSNDFQNTDYVIRNTVNIGSTNNFINDSTYRSNEFSLSENAKLEILEIPQVADVLGRKSVKLNIVFHDDIPEYLEVNEYFCRFTTSPRFLDAEEVSFYEMHSTSGENYTEFKFSDLTKDNLKEYMQFAVNPDYTYTKKVAGYKENEELFNVEIIGQSQELFIDDEITKENIIAGEINIDKLNSGEEVIICAPEKIGFCSDESGTGLYNLSPESETYDSKEENIKYNLKATAESPFKVGDTLKLSLLCDDGRGNVTREDKEVKIGAIVGKTSSGGSFGIFTTLEGLDTFSTKFNYEQLEVVLNEECTLEIDEIVQTELSTICPGKDILSVFALHEAEKQEKRVWIISLTSLVFVFLCVSISLINNSISAQIRDGKKALGTLRAVGASEKELVLSFVTQILYILLLGVGVGSVIYLSTNSVIGDLLWGEPFKINILPIIIMFVILALTTYINLKIKIKSITKNSIVENIREL
ncbi:MAG: ABC transporter permease [Clostridia bacterium]|nr:ABC transporter permease [Clostridia bacterium]